MKRRDWDAPDIALFRAMYSNPRYSLADIGQFFSLSGGELRRRAREYDVRRPKSLYERPAKKPANDRPIERIDRHCLTCGKAFVAEGPFQRMCALCRNPQSKSGMKEGRQGPYVEMPRFSCASVIGPAPTCQFPFGEPSEQRFCGKPSIDGYSWCDHHYVVVFAVDEPISMIREPRV